MGAFQIILLGLLAALLALACATDWRSREIPNALNLAIALGAPLWWWASGLALWPDAAWQVGLALIVLAAFAGLFALGAMGGGDVKLIAALALWFPLPLFAGLLAVMAVAGGILTLAMVIAHRLRRAAGNPEIPYGIAIAAGAAATIFRTIS